MFLLKDTQDSKSFQFASTNTQKAGSLISHYVFCHCRP